MGILSWIILGALAGWIASMVMKTDAEQGAAANIIVGIIGAFVGGLVMGLFDQAGVTGFNIRSVLVSVVGACIALAIYKAVSGRGHTTTV